MTSLIASPRQEFPKKLPALPVIEHPALRRSDDNNADLQIRGSSREESTTVLEELPDALPPLKTRINQQVSQGHSRVLTWPIGGKGKTNDSNYSAWETPLHKRTPEELEELIREKIVTKVNGLRQAFRSNDPMGKGNVSREALVRILYHLCGYLTTEQINGLLKRLGLDTQSTISFENFVTHFQDNETLTKEWVDPVVRPTIHAVNSLANLPANRLRQRQRELALEQKHAALKNGRKKTPLKFYSALEVFPQLKLRSQQETLSYRKIFPPSCFDIDGMVLKPQLRTALQALGYQMYEEEFDKVWDRFDRTGLGAVESLAFFRTLGINPFHENRKEVQKLSSTKSEKEELRIPTEKEEVSEQEKIKIALGTEDEKEPEQLEKEEVSGVENVLRLFTEKFKEGYTRVLKSFRKYDPEDTGQISRADFRTALSEYHLHLGPVEAEHFLQRCGMRELSMVPYKKLMDMYLDRSEQGRLQVILDDPKHRFNSSRESAIGNTTATDAEARLLDILQSDFLALLGAFKQLDRDNLGVIKRYQFKELLEARFNMKISDDELKSLVQPLNVGSMHGLVPYGRFLELFSSSRENKKVSSNGKLPSPRANSNRPATSSKELNSLRRPASRKELERSATQPEITKKESQPRSVLMLCSVIRELLAEKFPSIHKAFQGMDQLRKGYLSKGMFQRLFERYDLKFSSSEVDLLWAKLPSEKDGTVSFEDFVQHCFLNFNATSQGGDNGQSGSLSHILQEYAKSIMHKRLGTVPEEKEDEPEHLLTPPSQIAQDDQAGFLTDEKASLPPLKTHSKPTVETVLKRIKSQVCSQWSELRDAFIAEDIEGSATLDFIDFKGVLRRFCKDLTDEECHSLCLKFDRRKHSRVWYLEFLKYYLPTMPVKAQNLVPMSQTHKTRVQMAWSDCRSAHEAIDTVVGKIRNQLISDWKRLRRAFKKMDLSGDGYVSVTDFKAAMNKFNFPLHDEDFFHIFSVFDENMEGRISYVEFMRRSLSK